MGKKVKPSMLAWEADCAVALDEYKAASAIARKQAADHAAFTVADDGLWKLYVKKMFESLAQHSPVV